MLSPASPSWRHSAEEGLSTKSSSMACPSMVIPFNRVLASCPRQVPTWKETLTREAPAALVTTQPREVRVLNLAPK